MNPNTEKAPWVLITCDDLPDPIITFHADGRVTANPNLKPDEAATNILSALSNAFGDVVRQLREAREEAEKAKEARNRIAHEVRAPLLAQLQRLKDRIEQLENRNAEQGFTVDRLRQAEADAQLYKWR